MHKLQRIIPPYHVIGRIGPRSPSGPGLVVDTNVHTRDLLRRVNLLVHEAIGGVVVDGSVQVGKSLDVLQGYPVIHPYL